MVRLVDFTDNVAKSGLVPPEILSEAQAQLSPDPPDDASIRLARRLIQDGWLTSYQAKKILGGATRGFFLGGYRLQKPLGAGGMGKVFLAVNDHDERVAIKVLPPRKALEEENALRRFRREMDLSQRCLHPNLAQTLAVGSDDDVHFMVMEYIPGESLYEMVRSTRAGPLRVTDLSRLFLKLLDGLEAAHRAGLIHRDIKPSNIMITPDEDVKLLDLGLARALDEDIGITRANTVLGTLDYASPEQLRDAAKADQRSDLYSLGCTMYFALTGKAPFEGGDVINKIYKQRLEDPEPVETVAPGVPAAFGAVVRKLMSKNPAERHQNCAELRSDLARWTDPARVRAILGAEAEAVRSFHPPAPQLDEDELRLWDDGEDRGSDGISIRELGTPEPSLAPRHARPLPPLRAVLRPTPTRDTDDSHRRTTRSDESRWLIHFAIIAAAAGLLAIVFLTIFYHF
jgi:serine/threonine-protein kinase